MQANGFELSDRGEPAWPDYPFSPSFNLARISRSIPGPLEREVRGRYALSEA